MIGIGTDMVEVDRFRVSLERTPTLRTKLFTAAEREYADRANDSAERFAARFAAKEAVMKAMSVGIGEVAMADIEVIRAESGQPSILLHGAAETLAQSLGIEQWLLTMTHTSSMAQATAVAL